MVGQRAAILIALGVCSFVFPSRQSCASASDAPIGLFEGDADVGAVLHAGAVQYDAASGTYTVSGSGESVGSGSDAFHMVWKRVSGDVRLTSDIAILGKDGSEHGKAVLMVRQSLDADSAYAGVALSGDGVTSLEYRDEKGGATHKIQTNARGPKRLSIEKRGNFVYVALGDDQKTLRFSGASIRTQVQATFYVGIGVFSHEKNAAGKAAFAKVELTTDVPAVENPTLYSSLERVSIASTDRRVVYVAPERFEAPNWTHDGTAFFFNRNGHIYRLSVTGGEPALVDTGFANRCNNDHGISPDQTSLAISDQSPEDNKSVVYIVPIGGGVPRRVTQKSPSYWHGWSPDGKTLAFVGQRPVGQDVDFDIYTIPVTGGEETRLTTAKGLDDGPEYSPDGKFIYFNSERTGHMQIWRMRADGGGQEQVTDGEWNDWFPHISPDGKWMVFLSFEPGVVGHPPNQNVMLRIMSLADKKIKVLAKLFGGQGTINVPSWSPDSKEVAFVSYALVPADDAGKK